MLEPIQMAVAVVATLSLYSYRADFSKYSIFTVGVFKRLDRVVIETSDYECAEFHCEEQTDVAERRRFFKEIVVAGMPVLRYDKGEAHYCEDHVSFEVVDELDNPRKSKTDRLTISLAAAIVGFTEWKTEMEPDQDDPLSDVQSVSSGFADAFALMPIILMVLCAAVVMNLMQRFRGN